MSNCSNNKPTKPANAARPRRTRPIPPVPPELREVRRLLWCLAVDTTKMLRQLARAGRDMGEDQINTAERFIEGAQEALDDAKAMMDYSEE